jgi:hypothetical protein
VSSELVQPMMVRSVQVEVEESVALGGGVVYAEVMQSWLEGHPVLEMVSELG